MKLILKDEKSSLSREEKALLVQETATAKISRLEKVTCLLGSCKQFKLEQSREWQEMRLER